MYLCVSVLEADTHQIHSQIHRYKVYKTADKLVYCHEAMHVQLRMQDAGWSADVERHESDEDSDGPHAPALLGGAAATTTTSRILP